MTTENEVFVGIDVSKTSNQLAVLGQPKVALVACMRKLLSILTVMLMRKEAWRPIQLKN